MRLIFILYNLLNLLFRSSGDVLCKNCKYFIPLTKLSINNKFTDKIPERHIVNNHYGVCSKFYYESVHKIRNTDDKCGKDGLYFVDKNKTNSDYKMTYSLIPKLEIKKIAHAIIF
jgi:hypothetical protein